jgi:hypothetical protein
MSDNGYQGPGRGERWGCAIAAVIGIPAFIFLLLLDALGDCAPDTACSKGFLTNVLLPSVAVPLGTFLIVRGAFNNGRLNRR